MEILYRGHVTWKHRKLAFARNIYIYNIYNIYIIYITYIYIYIYKTRIAQALRLVKQVSVRSFIR